MRIVWRGNATVTKDRDFNNGSNKITDSVWMDSEDGETQLHNYKASSIFATRGPYFGFNQQS